MRGIGPHIYCNKCGQTACAVDGTAIQTCCNIKASLCGLNRLLVHCSLVFLAGVCIFGEMILLGL